MNQDPNHPGPNPQGQAPYPHTPAPERAVACAWCHAPVPPSQADYSPTGDIICTRCSAAGDIHATEGRAVNTMMGAAYSNLAIGIASFVFNPFGVLSIMAIVNAIYVTSSMVRDDWYKQRMGGHYHACITCAILGGAIGALPLIILVLALGAASSAEPPPY